METKERMLPLLNGFGNGSALGDVRQRMAGAVASQWNEMPYFIYNSESRYGEREYHFTYIRFVKQRLLNRFTTYREQLS